MKPYYGPHAGVTIYHGDALEELKRLPSSSVNCCVTSPPYWRLRDYGVAGQLGLEETPEEYIAKMVGVFQEVRRVLREGGTLWVNIGDSYANDGKWGGTTGGKHAAGLHGEPIGRSKRNTGLKPKDLVGIPWMLAFALRADGWYLRQDIIWSKPNPMPESVTDRCTKAHEYLFLLSKSAKYQFDANAIAEKCIAGDRGSSFLSDSDLQTKAGLGTRERTIKVRGGSDRGSGGHGTIHRNGRTEAEYQKAKVSDTRNKRSVWTIPTQPFKEAHFATFPEKLIKPCVLAGCPSGGVVLDPFMGSGTTCVVASKLNCRSIGIELNAEYIELAVRRLNQDVLAFGGEA